MKVLTRRRVKALLCMALALVGAVVLFHRPLPPRPTITEASSAAVPSDSLLQRALAAEVHAHPGLSGIQFLADGRDAFVARAVLTDLAEHSIDAQYYIWRADTAGRLLLQGLRRAADRGVRVRLLLDDNNTTGMDPVLMALDAHPNIQVRLFNPLMHRRFRLLDYVSDFSRTNRRMHNKSFTVDRQITVVGGRNVGNEYFGAGDGVMFADLDVTAVGAVVADVSADFERYWRSESTYPIQSIASEATEKIDVGTQAADDEATQVYLKVLQASPLAKQLRTAPVVHEWAPTQLVSDDPIKGLGRASREQTVLGRLREVMDDAKRSLIIVSPYFVPTQVGADALLALSQRRVSVSVLTNALSATDVAAVHSGYAKYRESLLEGGVRLFELKPSATLDPARVGKGWIGGSSSGASLHAKSFAVDGHRLFVGSFNMDPRSAALNTEMGLLIDSPVLAQRLSEALKAREAIDAYAVSLNDGQLRWTTREGGEAAVFEQEPHASLGRRVAVRILSWLPIEWLL